MWLIAYLIEGSNICCSRDEGRREKLEPSLGGMNKGLFGGDFFLITSDEEKGGELVSLRIKREIKKVFLYGNYN